MTINYYFVYIYSSLPSIKFILKNPVYKSDMKFCLTVCFLSNLLKFESPFFVISLKFVS